MEVSYRVLAQSEEQLQRSKEQAETLDRLHQKIKAAN
jgi:hypothetical protein